MRGRRRSPSAARRVVARAIGSRYAAEPGLSAFLCAGSTARGDADVWSDVELLAVWETPPGDEQRRRLAAEVGGRDVALWGWNSGERACFGAWWHDGPAGRGLLVELTHSIADDLGARVQALLRGDDDPALSTLGDALTGATVLAGERVVGAWRRRLVPYPRAVAAAVVRGRGQIDHFWRWRMYLERDEPLRLQTHFADVAERVVQVGCALSGVWWPGAKRMAGTAARLPVAPPDLAARLRRIPAEAPAVAAASLETLVEESYELVAQHLPEVDVGRLRAVFRFAREPW
jgi:hypothetical protein